MNTYNQQILKSQIEMRNAKNRPGMSDAEYLMNRDILEKASKNLNN